MQKHIVHDAYMRPLCRTKTTLSIDSNTCEQTIKALTYFCQNLTGHSNVFFHECMEDNFRSNNETTRDETEAILMSTFPKPVVGLLGHI